MPPGARTAPAVEKKGRKLRVNFERNPSTGKIQLGAPVDLETIQALQALQARPAKSTGASSGGSLVIDPELRSEPQVTGGLLAVQTYLNQMFPNYATPPGQAATPSATLMTEEPKPTATHKKPKRTMSDAQRKHLSEIMTAKAAAKKAEEEAQAKKRAAAARKRAAARKTASVAA